MTPDIKKNHNSGCEREVIVDVKTKSKNGEDKALMFKTSFREAVPFTVPAVKAKTFDKLYIYNLAAHSPVVGVGSLRLELLPFDGQTLGPASEMVTFSSDKLFEVLAAVPEAAAAFESITKAVPALLAHQKAQVL